MSLNISQMTLKQMLILVDAFLQCSCVNDLERRKDVIDALSSLIANNISRHSASRTDVLHIIKECGKHSDGFSIFLSAVEDLESNNDLLNHIKSIIDELQYRQELASILEKSIMGDQQRKLKISYWFQCSLSNSPENSCLEENNKLGPFFNPTDTKIAFLIDELLEERLMLNHYPLLIFAEGLGSEFLNEDDMQKIKQFVENIAKFHNVQDISSQRNLIDGFKQQKSPLHQDEVKVKANLNPRQIKQLRDTFYDFEPLRNLEERRNILDFLQNVYSIEISQSDDLTKDIDNIINVCQEKSEVFHYLLYILADLYGNESQFKKLKNLGLELFGLRPATAYNRTICIKNKGMIDEKIIINVFSEESKEDDFSIPRSIPKPSNEEIRREQENNSYKWKKIHTLCERFHRNYLDAEYYIRSGQVSEARKNLEALRECFNDFGQDLQDIDDERIFSFVQVEKLKLIPLCFEPLLESLAGQESGQIDKEYFEECGQKLATRIKNLLLDTLRLADSIIEKKLKSISQVKPLLQKSNHE